MARAFERAGLEVAIVSPPGVEVGNPGARPDRGAGLRRIWWTLAEKVPEFFFELMEIAYNVPAYFRLRRALRKPGVVALYERYAFFNVAGALAARASRVPFVLEVNYTTGTPLYRRRSRLLHPISKFAEGYVFRNAHRIATVSTRLGSEVAAGGIPSGNVVTVPNAADPVRFRPETSGAAVRARYGLADARVIGFTGAFFPWHGVSLLLEVLPELLRAIPYTAALLIGDGPERSALEERA